MHIDRTANKLLNPIIALTIIGLVTVIAFLPTFNNELMTGWDDQWQVVNTFTSTGFTWENLLCIFTKPHGVQYSPLDQCFYILIYLIDGYNPAIFHGASLIVHIANCVLVYLVIKRLLSETTKISIRQIAWMAFLTTLLFAIHPVQVESVAWMSASKVLLCTFFYLLATMTFMSYLREKRPYHYLLTLLLFLCAYGCKEQAVIFPVWATLVCVFYRVNFKSVGTAIKLAVLYAMALALGLIFVLYISSYSHSTFDAATVEYSWWQRIVFSSYSLIEYILKWYVPFNLKHLYYYPMNVGEALPEWMIAYSLLFVVTICLLWKHFKHWAILSGGMFFLIHIGLVLHIFPVLRPHLVADRYNYLPSIGLSFIAIYFFVSSYEALKKSHKRIAIPLAALIYITLGTYTFHRTQIWHDTKTLKKELFVPE